MQGVKRDYKADAGKTIDPKRTCYRNTKTISASQRSYDSLIEYTSKIIAILSTEPTYLPNELDLKLQH